MESSSDVRTSQAETGRSQARSRSGPHRRSNRLRRAARPAPPHRRDSRRRLTLGQGRSTAARRRPAVEGSSCPCRRRSRGCRGDLAGRGVPGRTPLGVPASNPGRQAAEATVSGNRGRGRVSNRRPPLLHRLGQLVARRRSDAGDRRRACRAPGPVPSMHGVCPAPVLAGFSKARGLLEMVEKPIARHARSPPVPIALGPGDHGWPSRPSIRAASTMNSSPSAS